MIDNFIKTILLTPDVIFDVTVGDLESEEIFKVFQQYEKLDKISTNNLLQGGRISFVEISNSLFDYIVSRLVIEEGDLKLASHMHIFKAKREIVLCLPYNKFKNSVVGYKSILTEKQQSLIQNLNKVSEELVHVAKFHSEENLNEVKEDVGEE